MTVPVLALDDPTTLAAATDVLVAGGVVLLPTDTVYGLAVRADSPEALRKLFVLKDRPEGVPVAVLVADPAQAWTLTDAEPAPWVHEAAARHWPGGLTLVLAKHPDVDLAAGTLDTIGVRCPDEAFVRDLAARVGPLATTSANRHGLPTPATCAEALEQVTPDLAIDGDSRDGRASTVVDATGDEPVVIRPGPVTL